MGSQTPPTHPEAVAAAAGPATRKSPSPEAHADATDIVEIWGLDSFPASDPPTNW